MTLIPLENTKRYFGTIIPKYVYGCGCVIGNTCGLVDLRCGVPILLKNSPYPDQPCALAIINPMARVVAIQNFQVESPELIAVVLREQGIEVELVKTYQGQPVPDNLDAHPGLVVLGGPMGVNDADKYPFITDVLNLISHALEQNKPVLGICLGSQLLAHVLGSPITKGKQKEIGWHPVTLSAQGQADALFTGCPQSFTPLHWHGDVYNLPAGATLLASSEMTPCQAFRFECTAYGILFHMEVTSGVLSGWAGEFAGEMAEVGLSESELLAGGETHLPTLEPIGRSVFSRWARMLNG